jgi:hypothetical protein
MEFFLLHPIDKTTTSQRGKSGSIVLLKDEENPQIALASG